MTPFLGVLANLGGQGPRFGQNPPKSGQKWPFWAQNGQKWPFLAHFWTTFAGFTNSEVMFMPKMAYLSGILPPFQGGHIPNITPNIWVI